MTKFLPLRSWMRGAVVAAAAFVLALQMLLAGVLATQMAVAASIARWARDCTTCAKVGDKLLKTL